MHSWSRPPPESAEHSVSLVHLSIAPDSPLRFSSPYTSFDVCAVSVTRTRTFFNPKTRAIRSVRSASIHTDRPSTVVAVEQPPTLKKLNLVFVIDVNMITSYHICFNLQEHSGLPRFPKRPRYPPTAPTWRAAAASMRGTASGDRPMSLGVPVVPRKTIHRTRAPGSFKQYILPGDAEATSIHTI